MTLDNFLCVWNHELAVIVQKSIQHLKNFRRGKIELVEYDPMPLPHRRHQVCACWLLRELAAATANPVFQQQQNIAGRKQHWHLIGYTRRRAVGLDMRQLLLRFITD